MRREKNRSQRWGGRFLVLLLGAGCAVSANNPGGRPGRLSLSGVIVNVEDHLPLAAQVSLAADDGEYPLVATADAKGAYQFPSLEGGAYTLTIGSFSHKVYVKTDTVFDVFLPTPAAPDRVWNYRLDNESFCVLWDDRSGLEAGFRVGGFKEYELPADSIGFRDRIPAANEGDGALTIRAFNEYGASVSVATRIPVEIAQSAPETVADLERCRTLGDNPLFLKP
jgi:hypothetical protein